MCLSSQTCLRKASIGTASSEMWKSTYLHLLPKLWILFVCRQKPKVGRCYFVGCHMFPELFIREGSHRGALFLAPVTKASPSLFLSLKKKNRTQQCCLPGFTVLMKIWSRAQIFFWKNAWNFPVADVSTEGACMPFVNTAPYGTQCGHRNITSK